MIKPLILGIILITAGLAASGQTTQSDQSLIKARYLVSEKMYAAAVSALENQQASGQDPMRSALTMGKALSAMGRIEESNRWLLQVTGEGAAEAFYCVAKNYIALNDFPDAILYLRKHLADKNHYTEKRIRLDQAFIKLENSRDWVHLWQAEWFSEPEKQADECEYLISQGQLDEARLLVNQAFTNYPKEPHFWFLLAKINYLQNDNRQFRQSLEKAWQLASGNLTLKDHLLQFTLETKYYEKANEMASELIREDPTNPEYLITRALVRILDGKESLALKEIEAIRAAGIAPAELYYQAGRKISLSLPQEAEAYLTRAIDTGIMDARFYYARGVVRNALEKIDLALGDMAMSLDINPNQPDLYVERAQLRLNTGNTDGACHDWQKALEMGNAKAADLLYKYCKLP